LKGSRQRCIETNSILRALIHMIIPLPLAHKEEEARGMGGMARIKKALELLVMLSEV
jgi:hypothetical protein